LKKAADQGHEKAKKALKKLERGCFITSAVTACLCLRQDSEELQLLRRFRDTYMQQTPERRAEVELYYRIAPVIIAKVKSSGREREIWEEIYERFIKKAMLFIRQGENGKAYALYKEMLRELSERFAAT